MNLRCMTCQAVFREADGPSKIPRTPGPWRDDTPTPPAILQQQLTQTLLAALTIAADAYLCEALHARAQHKLTAIVVMQKVEAVQRLAARIATGELRLVLATLKPFLVRPTP